MDCLDVLPNVASLWDAGNFCLKTIRYNKDESCRNIGFSKRENLSVENLNPVATLAFPVGKTVR